MAVDTESTARPMVWLLMKRLLYFVAASSVAGIVGAGVTFMVLRHRLAPEPDAVAVVERVREVLRLEAMEMLLYKKVSFRPDPKTSESTWGEVANWLRFTLRKPKGRAIVFADAYLSFDLSELGADGLRIVGDTIEVVLPSLRITVALKPGETEIIGSNLTSAETAQLFAKAKAAFEQEIRANQAVEARARRAAERGLRGLLWQMGFRQVRFMTRLPERIDGS